MDRFETTLRGVVGLIASAQHDVERIVGTRLPNVQHYVLLGRLDALAADVAGLVADTLAELKQ